MENEDKEASQLSNPSPHVEDDSMNLTTASAGTVMNSDDEVQLNTESQCEPESVTELSESQLPPPEQTSEVGKEIDENSSVVGEREGVIELDDSKVGGGRVDLSRDWKPVMSSGIVKEDRDLIDGEEKKDVANAEDVSGGDLVVQALVVVAEGDGEEVMGKEEREVLDGDEETEEKARVGDVAEGQEVTHETKAVDVAGEREKSAVTKMETEIKDEEKVGDVAEGTEFEDGTKAEKTGIVDDMAGETEERAEMAEDRDSTDERNAVDEAEETMIVDDVVAGEKHEKSETSEDMETAGESKAVDVADVGRAEMTEDREIAGETEVVNVAEEEETAKEIDVANLGKQTTAVEESQVANMTESTAADEMEVGHLAEETEMQEDDMELADVVGQETELVYKMRKAEEETEMQETTETDPEEMADVGEETMEVGAEIGQETEKAEYMETGEEVEEVTRSVRGKRKRVGKNSKSPGKAPSGKKSEEDVCFICFDGGDLVLCDRRGCPKAYHPSCVNRDEAFFRSKGRWNCGWHLCSICEKNAYYMCYTCTFSLCRGCIKDAVILCVRGNKGFCETCMKTVILIENNEHGNKEVDQIDFDDKNSWEYLFKDYWLDLKGRLSLSSDELARAKNPWKGSDMHAGKQDADKPYDANIDGEQGSDSSSGNAETVSKRRKAKKRSKSHPKEGHSLVTARLTGGEGASTCESVEWASKELLDLVMHMKNGDKSALSQFEVQTLLLEYIKKYKLRDPHRRTHVICDSQLQSLFGKPRVGHFEMLKLLESHFLSKEDSQVDELQGSVVDIEENQLEADGNSDALIIGGKNKKRKTRKKGDGRGLQYNLDDYAAIDMHNITLIYLRRNLVEELLQDTETFHDKVVGTFVRIRISGSGQKQDLYRLVQVVGTSKVAEPYKVGKRMTDILLEILNLNKTEVISIDIISNQEFTEDECKRLRQSIKCGLISRLTVGDIQEKAMALQAVRVKDWMEAEILRLSHLRDRASDLGRRKELRECVEKLQLLKTPEERQRRLEEIPEIRSDPKMDPSYESEEEDDVTDDKRQENYMRSKGSSFSRRGTEPISPGKGSTFSNDSFSGSRSYSGVNKELSRNMSNKGFSNRGEDFVGASEIVNENLRSQARDKETQQLNSWEKPRTASNLETAARNLHSVLSESISRVVSENSPASASAGVTQSTAKINESEKIWHYKDPSGKVQGPFSMVQLRKWSNTGYFPTHLRIWRSTEKQDDSILLTDALAGKIHKDRPSLDIEMSQTISYSGKPHGVPLQTDMETRAAGNSNFDQNRTAWNLHATLGTSGQSVGGNWRLQSEISAGGAAHSLELPKEFRDGWGSETSLPSPTPTQSTADDSRGKMFEKEWSPTPTIQSGSLMTANQFSGGNGGKQSPTVIVPGSGQLTQFSTPSSTSKLGSNIDGLHVAHEVTTASKLETVESHRVLVSPHQLPGSHSGVALMNPSVDLKNIGATVQSLVQPVNAHATPAESHGWGSGSAARPEMIAPSPKHGSGSQGWGSASSQNLEPNNPVSIPIHSPAYSQPYASSFSTGNSSGVLPASGQSAMPPSDPWRPTVPSQSNVQPPAQPIPTWGIGATGNQNYVPRQGSENLYTGWGPMPGNPSMGWGGQLPANTNMNWGAPAQGQAPGNANSGWAAPLQGQAPKNAIPGWVPPGQGPSPVSANPGWVAPGQGPLPRNTNTSWGAPEGNQGMRGSEQNNGGDRYSSQRDRASQGGDSGYGGGRHWNRQSSFGSRGGDSSRPKRVCKFHESGHCKKGSQCDYLHT